MDYSNLVLPKHIGIIIDGNGRWAVAHGKKRSYGHLMGSKRLREIGLYAFSKGLNILSIFAFSTENFKRAKEEVTYLMDLFAKNFKKELNSFKEKGVKVIFSGRRENLSLKLLKTMDTLVKDTENNKNGILNICLNYGGQSEIIDGIKKINKDFIENTINIDDLNEQTFKKYLYNELPEIDFLIRTSGENRISNFMLWQLAYAEMYFPKIHWPDFNTNEFDKAILEYNKRKRRFGGIK